MATGENNEVDVINRSREGSIGCSITTSRALRIIALRHMAHAELAATTVLAA